MTTTSMTSKQRMLIALKRGVPDRLPVTTHHLMNSFLHTTLHDMAAPQFFDYFDLDAYVWLDPTRPAQDSGQYVDPEEEPSGTAVRAKLKPRQIVTDQWRVHREDLPGFELKTTRFSFVTPKGTLSMVMQSNEHTDWVVEYLVKRREDIDILAACMPAPVWDVDAVNVAAEEFGERGLVRGGEALCFEVHGQPGCWQDALCLVDIQELIYATYDDPAWVHELLKILQRRKLSTIASLAGARYDLIELGGGAASSTVISPKLFDQYVAPYDSELIAACHSVGQRVVYHTCGGMMPILERVAAMHPDAMETFTPPGMGGDTDLAAAKRRIGDSVCMIGGFDQFHFFVGCTPEDTRAEVRRCFAAAGGNGGYILSPSDHFFEALPICLSAFADEAHRCIYTAPG